jgi:type III secretion protein W
LSSKPSPKPKKHQPPSLLGVTEFLLAALGEDMRSGGPSIERGQLQALMQQTRGLQAVLGVYTFFKKRMQLIQGENNRLKLGIPDTLDAAALTTAFMELVEDKYPSPIKAIAAATKVGVVDANPAGQVLIVSQFRDAVRSVAPKMFAQQKARDDLIQALVDALDQLEDKLDQMEGGK